MSMRLEIFPAGAAACISATVSRRFPPVAFVPVVHSFSIYVNDDKSEFIWALDINPDGTLANKRPFAELILHESVIGNERTKSFADGMTVDKDGNLYVCAAGFIQIFGKDGSYLGGITFPKQAFHCAFGGDDGSMLYVCCMKQVYRIQTKMKGAGL